MSFLNKKIKKDLGVYLGIDTKLEVKDVAPTITGATTLLALKSLIAACEAQGIIVDNTSV